MCVVLQLCHMLLWEHTVHKLKGKKIKLPNCLSGRTLHQFSQPHHRSVSEEPCQCHAAPMSPVCSSAIEDKLRFTQIALPLSLPPRLTTQVPPPPKLQWYLPLIIQLLTCRPKNLLQSQEGWVENSNVALTAHVWWLIFMETERVTVSH